MRNLYRSTGMNPFYARCVISEMFNCPWKSSPYQMHAEVPTNRSDTAANGNELQCLEHAKCPGCNGMRSREISAPINCCCAGGSASMPSYSQRHAASAGSYLRISGAKNAYLGFMPHIHVTHPTLTPVMRRSGMRGIFATLLYIIMPSVLHTHLAEQQTHSPT